MMVPQSHLNHTDLQLSDLYCPGNSSRALGHRDLALGQNLISEGIGTSAVEHMGNNCTYAGKGNRGVGIAMKLHFNQP